MKLCIVMVFVELLMFGDCETVRWVASWISSLHCSWWK